MANGPRRIPDRKKLVAIAHDIESREIQLENHKVLLLPRFLHTFRQTTETSKWPQKRKHTIYNTALSKGCHFFILFIWCTSERKCAEKSVAEFLKTVEENDKSYQFKLDRETIIAFRNWALEAEVPSFSEFTDTLIDPDITLVKRMLSRRGLQGTDSWTNVMSILFPDYPPSTEPHAAFDERQLAHGQGQGVTEVEEEGRNIVKFLIPRLSIRAGATYGGQEAVGVVGEQVPNKATGELNPLLASPLTIRQVAFQITPTFPKTQPHFRNISASMLLSSILLSSMPG